MRHERRFDQPANSAPSASALFPSQLEVVEKIPNPERQRGLWSFLTWSFFLAQIVVAAELHAKSANASDDGAALDHDGNSSSTDAAAGKMAPPNRVGDAAEEGRSKAEQSDGQASNAALNANYNERPGFEHQPNATVNSNDISENAKSATSAHSTQPPDANSSTDVGPGNEENGGNCVGSTPPLLVDLDIPPGIAIDLGLDTSGPAAIDLNVTLGDILNVDLNLAIGELIDLDLISQLGLSETLDNAVGAVQPVFDIAGVVVGGALHQLGDTIGAVTSIGVIGELQDGLTNVASPLLSSALGSVTPLVDLNLPGIGLSATGVLAFELNEPSPAAAIDDLFQGGSYTQYNISLQNGDTELTTASGSPNVLSPDGVAAHVDVESHAFSSAAIYGDEAHAKPSIDLI